jgi:hypothetical protein
VCDFRVAAVGVFYEVPDGNGDVKHCSEKGQPVAGSSDAFPYRECGHHEDEQNTDPDHSVRPELLAGSLELVVCQVPLEINKVTHDHHAYRHQERDQRLVPDESGHAL